MTKEIDSQSKQKKNLVAGLDIDKLVKKAQDAYDKKEVGLAKQITTGKTVLRPKTDDDFIKWTKNSFWQDLTHSIGLNFGRQYQCSGKSDSGKSSLAMAFMKEAQDQDVLVILWDSEKKFSPYRFDNKIGGCSDNLVVINTSSIIEGADAVGNIVHAAKELNKDTKILIVWDSAGASLNSTESGEEENYSNQPGVSAKQSTYAVKKFGKLINRYMNKETGKDSITTLIINQTYASIGMGAPIQIEKGGNGLYYLSTVIIQLSRKKDLTRVKGGEKYKYGIVSRAKVKKNHLFEGDEAIAEMDIVVSAEGIQLAKDVKSIDDIQGWNDADEEDAE